MALTLEPQVRREIERRCRQTHDRRIAHRLDAVLWVAGGRVQGEVAELLDVTERQARTWLRLDRTRGLEALCTLHHQGDPGEPRPAQIERLQAAVATGRFLTAPQVGDGIDETFHVTSTPRGVRDLRPRIGVSDHKATGFFWKANPDKQEGFIHTSERHKQEADGRKTRRYFADACHPVWGAEMLSCCWLPVGPRFLVGVGGGRRRLNILGACCPEDHEYLDLRLTRENSNGQQFVNSLRL